jgi:tetratricopeptide (TPR) repeat protein
MISKAIFPLTALSAALLLAGLGSGCTKLRARDHINKGVQAYKGARYPEAVEHFKSAVQLDPSFSTARLYLATAYMNQYIPGADSPENNQMAQAAQEEFLRVLENDSSDKVAIASLASLNYQQASGIPKLEDKLKKLDEARAWYEKLAQVDNQNKEAYYSLGVITWAKWYPELMAARNKLGMKPEDPGPLKDKKVREELKGKYSAMIEEGIKNLEKALEVDPLYDDAMAYMNLLIRERADLAETPQEYKKDIEIADNWVQKALDTKKQKAEKLAQAGTAAAPAAAETK